MLIDVPDGVAEQIHDTIDEFLSHKAHVAQLNSDESLDWFIKDLFTDTKGMVTRESDYKERPASMYRRFLGYTEYNGVADPPVMMRGARYSLHIKHSRSTYNNAWGWIDDVIDRYVRTIRLTTNGSDKEWKRVCSKIDRWLKKRGDYYGAHRYVSFFKPAPSVHYGHVYINGKEHHLNPKQIPAIKSLLRHADKLKDIDRAVERIEEAAMREQNESPDSQS